MKSNIILPLIIVIVALLIIIASSSFIGGIVPFEEKWSNTIEAISVTIALIISIVALIYAVMEYNQYKNSEKTNLLCQYLHRYAKDPSIMKITDYILQTAELDENGNIIGFDKTKTPETVPSVRDKEGFMSFFEQMELHIENNMLDRDNVNDLMCFYAGIFDKYKEFRTDITDYNKDKYWEHFHAFVKGIPKDFYD